MKKDIRILLLEDNLADAELVKYALREGGLNFTITRVDSKAQYLKEVDENPPDIVLLDYSLPDFDGFSALTIAQEKYPDIP
ncbi:MAG TPA: response regulator, partial [Candidatus Binatia bacterium]|nr:response regulator [Candidatus Binatia bacterium]